MYQAYNDQIAGKNKELFKSLIFCLCEPSNYFGNIIKEALKGTIINTKAINRVLVFRSEIDIDIIKDRYKIDNERDLIEDVKKVIKGDYCDFLCLLINKKFSRTPK